MYDTEPLLWTLPFNCIATDNTEFDAEPSRSYISECTVIRYTTIIVFFSQDYLQIKLSSPYKTANVIVAFPACVRNLPLMYRIYRQDLVYTFQHCKFGHLDGKLSQRTSQKRVYFFRTLDFSPAIEYLQFRRHKKSRKGCEICKRRHVRCDEKFPQW